MIPCICSACGQVILDPEEYHTRQSYEGPCTIEHAPEAWRFFSYVD